MRHHEVRDVMTADPVTVTPATPLRYVATSLVKHKLSAVPVLSLQGKVLGVISENDLLRKEELQRDPDGEHSVDLTYRVRRDMATAKTAGELMSTHPATVRPDATVAEAAGVMDRYDAVCLPVVDEGGNLLGVVGPRDLLRVFLQPEEQINAQMTHGTHPCRPCAG